MQRRLLLTAMLTPGLCSLTGPTWAETPPNPMLVSSGDAAGTYYRLMNEFNAASPGLIVNTASDGSMTNIDRVMNNQTELGMTQFDALHFRSLKEPALKDHIRVLAPLYGEEIHFIAKTAPRTEGGIGAFGINTGINAKTIYLNTINDLHGRRLGFWGGAVITEQVFAAMALIGWVPVEYPDQKSALEALINDQVDALMAVGGQPVGWVSGLSRDFKLLSVSDTEAARLSAVYDKAALTYRNLGQDGIQTLAVPAMLVTRDYTSRSKRLQLQLIHDRLTEAVEDIRETRGTHPKWGDIHPDATTDKWPMFVGLKQ